MDADELWDTTMNPERRNIIKVEVSDDRDAVDTIDKLLNNNSKFTEQRKVLLLKEQERNILENDEII